MEMNKKRRKEGEKGGMGKKTEINEQDEEKKQVV